MKRVTVGRVTVCDDAHAGLRESHPGHKGSSMCLPAESAMAVPTPKRRCCGNEAQRAAHALAREFAHRVIRLTYGFLAVDSGVERSLSVSTNLIPIPAIECPSSTS